MKTKKNTATQSAPDCPSPGPAPEEIASRAYLIWEQEGRPEGRDLDHWRQAEAQAQPNRRQVAAQE